MNFQSIRTGGFASNTYLLWNEQGAIVIDPGRDVTATLHAKGIKPAYVLLTHGHFDHIGGVAALQREGAKVGCYDPERTVALGRASLAEEVGGIEPFSIDFTFLEETILLLGEKVTIIATPGHTQGSCCFLIDGKLFTGDTLFEGSVGRTDLPTGSAISLYASLRKLFSMQEDYPVYPGHGDETTLFWEKKTNPYRKI
ncbi:MAG: MBL fold metallo-hydrolase [Clostridia bacterium]|nr:MBL fold metallo-hydrolase [Clostridia bacterium]